MSGRFEPGRRVAIVGYAHSQVERHSDRPLGITTIDTVRAAIADAGLDVSRIDGFVTAALFPTAGDHARADGVTSVSANWLAQHLGVDPSYVAGFNGMGQIPGGVAIAANAVAAGAADYVVFHRALHNPRARYHGSATTEFGGAQQWTAPAGFFGPVAMIALAYNEYRQRYGATDEAMAEVCVEARKNGSRIPWSYWHDRPSSVEEYLSAPMVVDPIRRLDCDLPVEGVAAFVLTTEDRARHLPHQPVFVAGYASAMPTRHRVPMHWPLDDIMAAGSGLAERLWRHSGVGIGDVDLPQVYDGFSPFVYFWMEALGMCPVGEAHRVVEEGGIDSDDPTALPVLSGGGAIGNGRMHGIPQMLECYLQLAGRAGDRQRERASVAIACHSSPHLGGAVVYRADG